MAWNNSSLPARPSFSSAAPGPSRPRQHPTHTPAPPQPQAYHPHPLPLPPQPNMSGGYQPSPMPMPWAGYNPYAQAYAAPSFGQMLFTPQPPATPQGYSYSQSYLNQAPTSQGPPSKRPRTSMGTSTSTSTGAAPPTMMNVGTGGAGAWRNCSHPGCKFVGPGEQVTIHEGDRHLIFPEGMKVERSEEEERYARQKG
jgi:hypothetical protein